MRAVARQGLTCAALVSLLVIIASDTWLHLPLLVTTGFALVLAVETCVNIFERS